MLVLSSYILCRQQVDGLAIAYLQLYIYVALVKAYYACTRYRYLCMGYR